MRTRTNVIWWLALASVAGLLLALIPVSAQAATGGNLCLYGSNATTTTADAMMAGTSPAIASLSGSSDEVAYQSSGGTLATYIDSTGAQNTTTYAMDQKSSPAITAYGGSPTVAFSSSDDQLYAGNGASESPEGVVLYAGTSPSVAAESASTVEYAYEGSNTDLYVGTPPSFSDQSVGMASGTSPAVTAVGTSSGVEYETAEQVNTGALWQVGPAADNNSQQGMASGTSPAIAGLGSANGAFEWAMESNTDRLYIGGTPAIADTGEAMAGGTDPSIAAIGASGAEIAFQGANGDLWVFGSDGTADTGHAMAPGTSPSITATSAGYEIAYQCAPVAATAPMTPVTVTQTATTPTPTPPTHSAGLRLRAKLVMRVFPDRRTRTTYVKDLRSVARLPHDATVSISCRAEIRADRCPRLGRLPKHGRTLAKELAIAAGRTYRHDNELIITVSARRYLSEIFSVSLPGTSKPTVRARYR